MRKIFLILTLGFALISNAKSEFIEFKNCYFTSFGESEMEIIYKGKDISLVYSSDHYNAFNIALKVPKKEFIDNYKKWGWDKRRSPDWEINKDPRDKGKWRLIGTDIVSTREEKPVPVIYDTWEELMEINYLDYILIYRALIDLNEDELFKLKSIGAELITIEEKNIFSIDRNSGIVTSLKIYSDDYVKYYNARELFRFENRDKKFKIEKPLSIKKIDSKKYEIETYAGGTLVAKEIFDFVGMEITIIVDFNEMTITRQNKFYEAYSSKQKCQNINDNETNEGEGSSGTAFFISNKGHLLTNNHVVEGCELSKISYLNKEYDAKLIATDKTLDLALLQVDLKPKTFINFAGDEPKKLNKIYVAGYPLGKGLSDDLKISSGIVSSLKGYEDNSNEIQIDAALNAGNSGGPIVNESGELVAIAVAGMSKDVTEGINFGIKSSAAERFLKSNNINPSKNTFSRTKDNNQLLEILEAGTVYTYCE